MKIKITGFIVFVFALFSWSSISAQEIEVSGTVSASDDGLTLPGVSVVVVGTTNGTSTDFDGNYTITVSQGDQLQFSFIGYSNQTITVENEIINVILNPDSKALEEVVVTGYSKETRATVAGSIATVKAADIESVPVASFDQALQGRAAGLQITSGSGQPGSASAVRIRGASSISGSADPLYIMDGVQISGSDFAALNPNDFASFSVLKDASATAIYGSRGTNGVIVITTKKGSEGKTHVNYRFNYGYSQRNDMKVPMMNSEQKLAFEEYAGRGMGWDLSPLNPANAGLSPEELELNRMELNRLAGINTNWTDIFTRNGITQQHELNASGGSQKTQYFMSISYFDQEGIAITSDLKRITGRFNFSHQLFDNLKLDANITIGDAKVGTIPGEGAIALNNPFATAYLANPYEKLYNEDGSYTFQYATSGARNYENLIENTRSYSDLKHVGVVSLQWDITNKLSFKTMYGIDNTRTLTEYGTKPSTWYGENTSLYRKGSYSESYSNLRRTTVNNLLTYNDVIDDVHSVSAMLGQEWVDTRSTGFGYSAYGINEKLFGSTRSFSQASVDDDGSLLYAPTVGGGSRIRIALLSYFVDGRYTYNGKYTIRGNFRMDASSKFTEENRWAKLGSGAVIWSAKKEAFLEDVDWLSDLRIRASYGVTGNQGPIGPVQKDFTWSTNSYAGQQGFATTNIDNKDLQWEVSHKSNFGIDYAFLGSRLRGSFELYRELVSKNFISYQLSRTTGFTSMMYNAGKMKNQGVEIELAYDITDGEFKWNVFGNYAYTANEITDLGQVDEFEQGTSIIREGVALGSHYTVGWAGVDPATGRPLYYDVDGNVTSIYSADNSVADFGTYIPPSVGGFGTNMSWKGIDFNMLFSFQTGFKRFNNQRFFNENHNFAQYNMSVVMEDIWREPGDITEIQSKDYNLEFTSKFIEDASFLRLRDISIGYSLPKSISNMAKMENLRVYGRVQNLLTWTSWSGFDPEDSNNIASYEYPTPTIFTLGLDVKF